MSGHSKWSTIKRKKAVTDAKRGQAFTRLAREISMAAREGGGSTDTNFTLRVAVESLAELEWDPARQIGTPTSRNNGQNTGAAL